MPVRTQLQSYLVIRSESLLQHGLNLGDVAPPLFARPHGFGIEIRVAIFVFDEFVVLANDLFFGNVYVGLHFRHFSSGHRHCLVSVRSLSCFSVVGRRGQVTVAVQHCGQQRQQHFVINNQRNNNIYHYSDYYSSYYYCCCSSSFYYYS